MRYAIVACLILLLSLIWLPAAQAAPPLYVYIPAGEELRGYRVGENGTLTPLSPPNGKVAESAGTIAIHPSGRYLYASYADDTRKPTPLRQYRIGDDGLLTPLMPATLTIPGPIRELVMHPGGKLLFATGNDGRIHVYAIGAEGRLTARKPAKVSYTFFVASGPDDAPGAGEREGHQFRIDPSGKYAYNFVSDGYSDHAELYLTRYRVGADGQLKVAGKGYEWRSSGDGAVRVMPGNLTFVPKAGLVATTYSSYMGSYLYRLRGDGTLSRFSPERITLPKAKGEEDYGEGVTLKAADPLGRFLYFSKTYSYEMENQKPNFVYRLKPGGRPKLEKVAAPGSLVMDPRGQFAYAIEIAEGNQSYGIKSVRLTPYRVLADGRLEKTGAPPLIVPFDTDAMYFAEPAAGNASRRTAHEQSGSGNK
jgi:hypothetical protein